MANLESVPLLLPRLFIFSPRYDIHILPGMVKEIKRAKEGNAGVKYIEILNAVVGGGGGYKRKKIYIGNSRESYNTGIKK